MARITQRAMGAGLSSPLALDLALPAMPASCGCRARPIIADQLRFRSRSCSENGQRNPTDNHNARQIHQHSKHRLGRHSKRRSNTAGNRTLKISTQDESQTNKDRQVLACLPLKPRIIRPPSGHRALQDESCVQNGRSVDYASVLHFSRCQKASFTSRDVRTLKLPACAGPLQSLVSHFSTTVRSLHVRALVRWCSDVVDQAACKLMGVKSSSIGPRRFAAS